MVCGGHSAFQSVKNDSLATPDRFDEQQSVTILDVAPDSNQVHIDTPLPEWQLTSWTLEDEPVRITRLADHLLEVHTNQPLMPGQEIIQKRHIVDIDQMLDHLCKFWSARWQKMATTR